MLLLVFCITFNIFESYPLNDERDLSTPPNSLLQTLGHRLSVFNGIYHMLDKRSLMAYFNGIVLPHLNYADVVWGDQPGLTTQMKQLQSFQNRFEDCKGTGDIS